MNILDRIIDTLAERRAAEQARLDAIAEAACDAELAASDETAERLAALERRIAKLESTAVRKRPQRRGEYFRR